jgi:predicted GH43/DUF377 family glycosyl hydrolase
MASPWRVAFKFEYPTRVIGRRRKPWLCPNEAEREGDVANVVYSGGSLRTGRDVIFPYAMSDAVIRFATVLMDELAARIE